LCKVNTAWGCGVNQPRFIGRYCIKFHILDLHLSYNIKRNASLMQQGNFIDVFLA